MNKPKLSVTAASRALFNVFLVIAMVVLASVIGVGGAALWFYSRPDTSLSTAKSAGTATKATAAATEQSNLPQLSPVRSDAAPAQLTAARYMPADTEIATLSDAPRYTYVSYNGGRQQAHLRVTTVLTTATPAAEPDDTASAQVLDRPPLTDAASHYITDASGRVIGIDGSAGAIAEAQAQPPATVARALPVKTAMVPEVRVAAPVTDAGQPVYASGYSLPAAASTNTRYLPIRKALPVSTPDAAAPTGFNLQAELSQDEDRPVLRAQPVSQATRASKPTLFGAGDNFQASSRD